MNRAARNSIQLAQIELGYAELELLHIGYYTSELRRILEHIVSAKKHLRQLRDGIESAEIDTREAIEANVSTIRPNRPEI
jgi:hypothetical protein